MSFYIGWNKIEAEELTLPPRGEELRTPPKSEELIVPLKSESSPPEGELDGRDRAQERPDGRDGAQERPNGERAQELKRRQKAEARGCS